MVRFDFVEYGFFIFIKDKDTGKEYDINFDIIDVVNLMNEQENEIKYLKSLLDYDLVRIEKQSEIIKDLGADSLDIVEMLMGLEEEFGIEVSEDEAVALRTVGDIVAVIDSKK